MVIENIIEIRGNEIDLKNIVDVFGDLWLSFSVIFVKDLCYCVLI